MKDSLYGKEYDIYKKNDLIGSEVNAGTKDKNLFAHFTQIVWKGSKQMGVGYCTKGKKTTVVLRYKKSSNYPLKSVSK